jgi:hypothetical protein
LSLFCFSLSSFPSPGAWSSSHVHTTTMVFVSCGHLYPWVPPSSFTWVGPTYLKSSGFQLIIRLEPLLDSVNSKKAGANPPDLIIKNNQWWELCKYEPRKGICGAGKITYRNMNLLKKLHKEWPNQSMDAHHLYYSWKIHS